MDVWLLPFLTSAIDTDKWTDLHPGTCYKDRTPVLTTRMLSGPQTMSVDFRGEKERKQKCKYSGITRSVIREYSAATRTAVIREGGMKLGRVLRKKDPKPGATEYQLGPETVHCDLQTG